jgi:hypothetical protein
VLRGPEETEALINGQIFMRWANVDEAAERMVIVLMCETGKGTQEEIAVAFGVHVNSVYNYIYRQYFERNKLRSRSKKETWH